MMEGWRSVEEGGKSLKGACERLLEERVSIISSSKTYLLKLFLSRTIYLRLWKISAVIWNFSSSWTMRHGCLTTLGSRLYSRPIFLIWSIELTFALNF